MGVFSASNDVVLEEELQPEFIDELVEAFFYDDLSRMSEEDRQKVMESSEFKSLEEAGLIGRQTRVQLSKVDDLDRRITMAAMLMAKTNNDFLWDQLKKAQLKRKELISKIKDKYGNKGTLAAKVGQKKYLKTHKIMRMGPMR